MAAFLDICRFSASNGGTADWVVGGPVGGYLTPATAGAANGRAYKYRAESVDLSQWELGEGIWNASTGVLSRTTVLFNSSGTASKINFSTPPQIAVVALKEDLVSIEEANGFTPTQQGQARSNIGAAPMNNPAFTGTVQSNGTIVGPSGANQYSAQASFRAAGNSVEFGHTNAAGYGSTLGAETSSGNSFLAFNAGAGSTNNTYKTFGLQGSVLRGEFGGFGWYAVTNTNADNQSLTPLMSLSSVGLLIANTPTQSAGDNSTKLASTAWVYANQIPPGTLMLFQQTSAPTGWTKQTTHNDKALRVVSGAASSGGANAFSTVMAQTVVGSTTISTSTMPSHNHGISDPGHSHTDNTVTFPGGGTTFANGNGLNVISTTGTTSSNVTNISIQSAGGGGSHNHSITMNVQYVDVIIASKN